MHYYTLGRTGLKVSRLALGTMTFGDDWGWGADDNTSRRIFNTYVEAGGNFFDTADMYTNGRSEEMLGQFIRDAGIRNRAVIATKFSYNAEEGNPNAGGNGRKNILRAVEGSLKRLATDYIDLYILHTWDQLTPAEEVMRTLDDLVTSGKVRHIGLSNCPAWYASRAQTLAEWRGFEPVSALQLEYSLVERTIEHEYTELAIRHGMGIMVWSPLASGLLSGKYRAGESGVHGEGRLKTVADSGNPVFEKFTERNWQIVAELEKVASEMERSMAEVALNWVVNRPAVASVLVGATRPEQLQSNLAALDFDLPEPLQARLNQISDPDRGSPYLFFGPELQAMIAGGAAVGKRPSSFYRQHSSVGG